MNGKAYVYSQAIRNNTTNFKGEDVFFDENGIAEVTPELHDQLVKIKGFEKIDAIKEFFGELQKIDQDIENYKKEIESLRRKKYEILRRLRPDGDGKVQESRQERIDRINKENEEIQKYLESEEALMDEFDQAEIKREKERSNQPDMNSDIEKSNQDLEDEILKEMGEEKKTPKESEPEPEPEISPKKTPAKPSRRPRTSKKS